MGHPDTRRPRRARLRRSGLGGYRRPLGGRLARAPGASLRRCLLRRRHRCFRSRLGRLSSRRGDRFRRCGLVLPWTTRPALGLGLGRRRFDSRCIGLGGSRLASTRLRNTRCVRSRLRLLRGGARGACRLGRPHRTRLLLGHRCDHRFLRRSWLGLDGCLRGLDRSRLRGRLSSALLLLADLVLDDRVGLGRRLRRSGRNDRLLSRKAVEAGDQPRPLAILLGRLDVEHRIALERQIAEHLADHAGQAGRALDEDLLAVEGATQAIGVVAPDEARSLATELGDAQAQLGQRRIDGPVALGEPDGLGKIVEPRLADRIPPVVDEHGRRGMPVAELSQIDAAVLLEPLPIEQGDRGLVVLRCHVMSLCKNRCHDPQHESSMERNTQSSMRVNAAGLRERSRRPPRFTCAVLPMADRRPRPACPPMA